MSNNTRKLTGGEFEELQQALISAFPSEADLREMVRFQIEENLGKISQREKFAQIVFDLIQWAESQGRLDDLITGARKQNSGNPELQRFAEKFYSQDEKFIHFTNRETEKEVIQIYLRKNYYVQVNAPAGLGKTYLLREIQRELELQTWNTVWIDFAEEHRACQADLYQFLQEFANQVLGHNTQDISTLDEEEALRRIGRQMADQEKIILFLDNADRGDRRTLDWIRRIFLEKLAKWNPVSLIASGQYEIPEWKGYSIGSPFHMLPLSSFDDTFVLQGIINSVVERFGARQAKQKQQTPDWQTDVETMLHGLYSLTRGHPLAIERVLRHAAEYDGFVNATFFMDNRHELCRRQLSPMVGERILPTLDRSVREAFRTLCIFRFISPNLIQNLCSSRPLNESSELWEPLRSSNKHWRVWWAALLETHLISNVSPRQMYPLSPVIRQIVAMVLQDEDESLYQARNQFARELYEKLSVSKEVPHVNRMSYFIEVLYHMTQDGSLGNTDAFSILEQTVQQFLENSTADEFWLEATPQLFQWMREDTELCEVINQYADTSLYDHLLEIIENYIHDKQEQYL